MREVAQTTLLEQMSPKPASAIRTPGQFVAALEQAASFADDPSKSAEFEQVAEAVRSAPFLIRSGQVVAKGFTPRLID